MIRKHTDDDFTKVGYGNVCDMKKIIIDIFSFYKLSWDEKDAWDFSILEFDNNFEGGFPYRIEVWCGKKGDMICVFRNSIIDNTNDFLEQTKSKEIVWKEMIRNIGVAGASTAYLNTLERVNKDKR